MSLARKNRRRAEREHARGLGRDLTVPFVDDIDAFLAELRQQLTPATAVLTPAAQTDTDTTA